MIKLSWPDKISSLPSVKSTRLIRLAVTYTFYWELKTSYLFFFFSFFLKSFRSKAIVADSISFQEQSGIDVKLAINIQFNKYSLHENAGKVETRVGCRTL